MAKNLYSKRQDFNGNNPHVDGPTKKQKKDVPASIKDQVVASDGRIFYPCQYCNKVFPKKKSRTFHIKECSAKDYILSVGNVSELEPEEIEPDEVSGKKSGTKIDIQQNILLNEQINVEEILSKSASLKEDISFVLKENNSNDDFAAIAKRLENNAVTITKHEMMEETGDKSPDKSDSDSNCKDCPKEFESPLDLLRHSRNKHSYPKVVMAMSEVQKYYGTEDRSQCPICRKPLKTNFRSAFVKHLHTHTNEMKYSCKVCNRKFRRSDHMKTHMKRHVVDDKGGS